MATDVEMGKAVMGDKLPADEAGVGQMHEHFAASWQARNLGLESENAFEHYHLFKGIPTEDSISSGTLRAPKPAIIIGSGPSADQIIPHLKGWKGGVFCSTSHITTLAKYGVAPTVFASPDPVGNMDEFAMPDVEMQKMVDESIMAAAPIQPIDYTKFWKGRRHWFLIFDPTKEWYSHILQPRFAWIKDILLPFSANLPALLSIAQYLNYSPIYLTGADFSGTRFTQWRYHKDKWEESKGELPPEGHRMNNYHGNATSPNMMWAWRGMMCVSRINAEVRHGNKWHIYNCGKESALHGTFPYADPSWLLRKNGRGQIMTWTKKQFVRELDIGLCRFNTFVFAIHNGIEEGTRVQMGDSWDDIENQLRGLNMTMESGAQLWKNMNADQRKHMVDSGVKFDPDKIRTVDVPKFMEYAKWMKAEIQKRDGKKS